MASIHAYESADSYQAKHKTIVDELCTLARLEANKRPHMVMTSGVIRNDAKGNFIKIHSKHDWEGKNTVPAYPDSIPQLHTGLFVHSADLGKPSSKGAVIYSDEFGFGVLLAWSVLQEHITGSANANKVYVETRPIDKYMSVNWDDIEAKLEASSDLSYDETAGNVVFGKIGSGNKAPLVATYVN